MLQPRRSREVAAILQAVKLLRLHVNEGNKTVSYSGETQRHILAHIDYLQGKVRQAQRLFKQAHTAVDRIEKLTVAAGPDPNLREQILEELRQYREVTDGDGPQGR